jgi:WD40 repeat protein
MAYVSYGRDILLWDGEGIPTHILTGAYSGNQTRIAIEQPALFTPDGKLLVTSDAEQTIKIWNVASGKLLRSFGGGLPEPSVLAISPDGKYFATFALKRVQGAALVGAAVPEKIRIWDIASGKLTREIAWGDEGCLLHQLLLQFAPDNQSIIAVDEPCRVRVDICRWRIKDGEQIGRWSIPGPNIDARAIAIDPSGRTLALGNYFGIVRLFDLATGKEKTSTEFHASTIECLAFASAGDELWTTGADATFRRWEAASGKPIGSWRLSESANAFQIAKDHVIAARLPGKTAIQDLKILDPRSGAVQREIERLYPFVISPDGKTIWAAGHERDRLSQWDLDTGKTLVTFPIEPSRPIAAIDNIRLIVTTNDKEILGWGADGRRKFSWSLFEQKLLRGNSNNWSDQLRATAISPDGRYIAVSVVRGGVVDANEMQSTYVCDLPTGKTIWRSKSLEFNGDSLAFRPDGKVLAIGGRTIRLVNAMTGQKLVELDGHSFRVIEVAFSPDGKRLASGSFDGTAMVWDVSDINP